MELLKPLKAHYEELFDEFRAYKGKIPVCGCVLLDPSLTKVVLVQNWATTTLWMNWAVAAACVVALVALLPVRERQFRLERDLQRGEALGEGREADELEELRGPRRHGGACPQG